MATGTLAEAPVTTGVPATLRLVPASTDALGEEIAALAARLHAATYELLVLLREFDERTGWSNGFASCAHWLHWRTGIALGAARDKVRVAHALATLPRVSATMARGAISYGKVRALTRVATADNEAALLDFAQAGTAAHVERFARAWRRVGQAAAAKQTEWRHLHRYLSTWVDDDGMVVIRGRLTPEVGAVLQRALESAADHLFREAQGEPKVESLAEEVTPAQRRADALGLLAEAALTSNMDRGTAGDRYQVVLHLDGTAGVAAGDGLSGVMEVDNGAVDVSAETSRRLSCDASMVPMRHSAGAVLAVGRRTRTVPPSIRRALQARDRSCRFPGCTARRCDAHHVEHWIDGGATSLGNLVLLCRRHPRAVHEGGFELVQYADGTEFVRPDGAVLKAAPPLGSERHGPHSLPPATGSPPVWDGTPFNVAWAIDVLWRPDGQLGLRSHAP